MPSKRELERRKGLVREMREQSRATHEARRQLAPEDLVALFDHLDGALAEGCDHTLRFTRQFLAAHSLPIDLVVPWLAEYGGYCDCEVLANVEESWPEGRAI